MTNEVLFHYTVLSSILFAIGILGMLVNRKNLINILISLEISLLAANMNFVVFSYYLAEISGRIFSLVVLTMAAAETAIGLAILVVFFRNKGSISIERADEMKG